jgi:hypothetical protein
MKVFTSLLSLTIFASVAMAVALPNSEDCDGDEYRLVKRDDDGDGADYSALDTVKRYFSFEF